MHVALKSPRRDGVSVELITLLGDMEERADQRWQAMEEKRLKLEAELRSQERKHEERMLQMMMSFMAQSQHAHTPAPRYIPPPTTPSYNPPPPNSYTPHAATYNPHTHSYIPPTPLNPTQSQPSPHILSFSSTEEHD